MMKFLNEYDTTTANMMLCATNIKYRVKQLPNKCLGYNKYSTNMSR